MLTILATLGIDFARMHSRSAVLSSMHPLKLISALFETSNYYRR